MEGSPDSATAAAGRGLDTVLAIASAAVIAWGVLGLAWSVFTVMALFWFENVVIGGFNVLRMLVSGVRLGGAGVVGALAMAAFFTVHYGLFTAVHGIFVVMLFGMPEMGRQVMDGGFYGPLSTMVQALIGSREGWLAIMAIVTVHAVGFVQWAIATRESPAPLKDLMAAPYGRIVVLHITLIAGGFLVMSMHAPELGVLLLVALKLGYDLLSLRRAANRAGAPGSLAGTGRPLVVGRRNVP